LTEFTGERVVPGQVEPDLWNEHFGRYAFAARLSRMKRVLDAGSGMGYGSAELARVAASVVGVDISGDAVVSAREHYNLPRVKFLQGSCVSLPFRAASFDLVVAFEVIEHLKEWRHFLEEARRVLAPGGQCLISTPNRDYYADSRGRTGPNPFHEHEFTFEEFRQELLAFFPHVALFLQNHVDGFVFQPAGHLTPAEARLDQDAGNSAESNFFLAVCALSPQTGAPTFLYVPKAANVLRERERHIEKLGEQIAEINQDRTRLLDLFRQQTQELERQAAGYEGKIDRLQQELQQQAGGYEGKIDRLQQELQQQAGGYEAKIAELQQELQQQAGGYETKIAELQQELQQQASGYETKVRELEAESRKNAEWAIETTQKLEGKCQELAECVRLLHETEKTVEERSNWALQLDEQISQLNASLHLLRGSRWVKLGNALGMGPRLRDG
jgi:SAM-dependent methyltransferase